MTFYHSKVANEALQDRLSFLEARQKSTLEYVAAMRKHLNLVKSMSCSVGGDSQFLVTNLPKTSLAQESENTNNALPVNNNEPPGFFRLKLLSQEYSVWAPSTATVYKTRGALMNNAKAGADMNNLNVDLSLQPQKHEQLQLTKPKRQIRLNKKTVTFKMANGRIVKKATSESGSQDTARSTSQEASGDNNEGRYHRNDSFSHSLDPDDEDVFSMTINDGDNNTIDDDLLNDDDNYDDNGDVSSLLAVALDSSSIFMAMPCSQEFRHVVSELVRDGVVIGNKS